MSSDLSLRLSTGIQGLDEILCGGLIPRRSYLVRGGPGSGKTTLGLHFLSTGIACGQRNLFVSLEENQQNVCQNAKALGLDLTESTFLDLSPTSEFFSRIETYDIFSAAEVEREPLAEKIVETVEKIKPDRVFLDPLTQFRYLSHDLFQYRKQVLSFLRFLTERGATVVFTSENSSQAPDEDLQFMADGIIELKNTTQRGRAIVVSKSRGSEFKSGRHSMTLTHDGIKVFPRLIPDLYQKVFEHKSIASGVPELDELLCGGIERGTVTILSGPSGVGKTTLGLQFMKEAAGRGERSVVYSFEEEIEIMLQRCESINIPARTMIEKGTLSAVKLEPLQMSPDEFANLVRHHVEQANVRVVMFDSVAGFRLSTPENQLVSRLHALLKYFQNMGVAVFVIAETQDVIGNFQVTDAGISYLGDNVIFLRYLEVGGELRKAIGVLKKRLSNFEKTLREFEITRYGIKVGKPILNLRGILTGTPEWVRREDAP